MATTSIQLALTNPVLAALAARTYKQGYTNVPNVNLPAVLREQCDTIYKVLTGNELPLDDTSIAIKAQKDGSFDRLYPPKLYKSADGLAAVIRWGTAEILLDNELKTLQKLPAKHKMTVAFSTCNFSGRGDDPSFRIKYFADKDVLTFDCAVACKSYKDYSVEAFNTAYELEPESVLELITCLPTGESGGGTIYDVSSLMKDYAPNGTTEVLEFPVISYRAVTANDKKTGKDRTTYVLKCLGVVHEQLNSFADWTAGPFETWGNPATNALLCANPAPAISEQQPAVLVVSDGRRPWLKIAAEQFDAGSVNLDF
jgi:hypothetical protein